LAPRRSNRALRKPCFELLLLLNPVLVPLHSS
jgi:hypothetical protein